VKLSADSIATAARMAAKSGGLPPVHLWNPEHCGALDIRIARDGLWYYLGTPIGRPELVRLFSTILRRDGDDYYLVTPGEKVLITVDDAPFVAIDFSVSGEGRDQGITFTTNVGDSATAGPDHPIRVTRDPDTGEPSPYIMIRAGLEALIDRKSFYRLADIGTTAPVDGTDWFGLWSGGVFFALIPAAEMQ